MHVFRLKHMEKAVLDWARFTQATTVSSVERDLVLNEPSGELGGIKN